VQQSQAVRERFSAQLLTGSPAAGPDEVVRRILAVQGQDPRGARLAIRARSAELTAADVDRALTHERSLLITWLNRGTLHLVCSEDYWWLHPLTAPRHQTGVLRRLSQLDVSLDEADRGVAVIEAALAGGPLSRPQLRDELDRAGVRTQGQALIHLLALASLRGRCVRGPVAGPQHAYVLVADWLGKPGRLDRDVALAELARRYLAGHGPASDRDLAGWAGVPLGDARRGLAAIGAELTERPDGLVDLTRMRRSAELPPPRLLGPYDPLLHGWQSREPVLGGHQQVVTVNGLFRPFALVDGMAAGIWSLPAGEVKLAEFGGLSAGARSALAADASDVLRFLHDGGDVRDPEAGR
jgi:Winged helix DNA-binding domain